MASRLPPGLRILFHALIGTSPLVYAGCAAVPLATVGTMIGVGSSAVSSGTAVYRAGILDSAEHASLEATWSAVAKAAQDLSLSPRSATVEADRCDLTFVDDHGTKLWVNIRSRTPTLTRLRIDVGALGSEPTARLMHERVRIHLDADNGTMPRHIAARVSNTIRMRCQNFQVRITQVQTALCTQEPDRIIDKRRAL